MDKRTEFNHALKDAIKNKHQVATSTIRLILAALKDRDIKVREQGKSTGIEDGEILSMLQSMIKQRIESAKTYQDAGRSDLESREQEEITILEKFLPQQMNDDEIHDAVKACIVKEKATGLKDMGRVMAALKTSHAGSMDMGKASKIVKEELGA